MKRALILLALAACSKSSDKPAPAPAPPPAPDLVSGPLPAGPEAELARSRCVLCHTEQYLTQQRLSPEGWKKVVAKMQKFGAPIDDAEAATLATWLASVYTPELPVRPAVLAELPASALP